MGYIDSKNEGLNWEKVFQLKAYLNFFTITSDNEIFFQQSYGDKAIYYSQDYGETWKNIPSPQNNIYSFNATSE